MVSARRLWPLALFIVGLLVLVAGALLVVGPLRPGQAAPPQPTGAQSLRHIIDTDSFPAPASAASHDGERVKVPDLGIDLPIIEGDGINVPYYKAAHYPGLKWPGEGDRAVLYAHAQSGMFGPLFRAHVGQKIDIDLQSGRALHYTIAEYHPQWPATDLSIVRPVGHEELVLLTCTTYNPYDPRIIVVAKPVAP
jgi:LPXTG-site transpeptidase (sortase) family protein